MKTPGSGEDAICGALHWPVLLADIGGTNARFALQTAEGRFVAVAALMLAAYTGVRAAVAAYLSSEPVLAFCSGPIRHAALAVANPVDSDTVKLTNGHWQFSIEALRLELGLETLLVVNDFAALAMSLPHLAPHQRSKIGGGTEQADGVRGLVGAGTGLGVSGLIFAGDRWLPLAGEGGHVSFAPFDEAEIALLRFCWREHGHVSAERLLSGAGLELLCRALADADGEAALLAPRAAQIVQRALDGSCARCVKAVEVFCGLLGSVAGNLALTLGASGGVYIGGGISPRLGSLFVNSPFRARFEAKGRFAAYLERIPTYLITEPYPAFPGIAVMLAEHLAAGH